ncbi:MAG TPA: chondroitinase-B domain-containing protein, partial [Candidatus Acidoferrum sp.]|nr:chondroitinase-B domain-containing protein [Candidatus Acidoferrum sp.]
MRIPAPKFYAAKISRLIFAATFLPACLMWLTARAEEVLVSTPNELTATAALASPGDTIVMRDGVWTNADILFIANGSAEHSITLRAQTLGGVHLIGQSRLRMAGSNLVVDGLVFTNGYRTNEDIIAFRESSTSFAYNSRLTNCAVINYNPPNLTNDTKWVSLYGTSNRVDSCYFRGKQNVGATMVVWVDTDPNKPNYHVISRNYFGPRPELTASSNDGETIRIGTSDVSMNLSRTTVEDNYLEQCNGEAEIISNKSCENTYRRNTFFECEGSLTLRHGNRCVVEGNFFIGRSKTRTGGVRIIGEDHKVYNNYFQDLAGTSTRAPLVFMKGIGGNPPPLNGYYQVQRATVAFNTFINCATPILIGVDGTSGTNTTTLPPIDCIVANNIVVQNTGTVIDPRTPPTSFAWEGNYFYGVKLGMDTNSGTIRTNPLMTLSADQLYRPSAISPVLGAAQGSYTFVTNDFEGHGRLGLKDVGADQASVSPPLSTQLTSTNVGPLWLRTTGTFLIWAPPADIFYGTPLGGLQLNASANAGGSFAYDPATGTVLNVGSNQLLKVIFTPNSTNYLSITQNVTINVRKGVPAINWANPAPIAYGTSLNAMQLNPTSSVQGSFTFNPPPGVLLNVSNGQVLTATFTPTVGSNYLSATASVLIDVIKATPVISWPTPGAIEQATPLTTLQLNALVNAPGTLTYNPPLGTVMIAGSHQPLSVIFTPANSANYLSSSATVEINVTLNGKTRPNVGWAFPAPILFGAPLGSAQLNATSDVPGTFIYSPAAGTILPAGNGRILSARFVPSDANSYMSITNTVTIDITAAPTNPIVRIAYLIPTNRLAQAHAVSTLQALVQQYQRFFAIEMERNGFGPKTFSFETQADGVTPAIHEVRLTATDIFLRGDFNGSRVLDKARAAGFPIGVPGQVWWLIAETHTEHADGVIGGGFDLGAYSPQSPVDAGWMITGGGSLALYQMLYQTNAALYDGYTVPEIGPHALVQDVSFPWFQGITLSGISSSEVGAGLRNLGKAFGLESDFRNDENFNGNVMGFGFRGIRGVFHPERYPYNYCGLSVAAAMTLNSNPYFNPGRVSTDSTVPSLNITTSGSIAPLSGLIELSFEAADNENLSAALLKWHTDSGLVMVGEMSMSGT